VDVGFEFHVLRLAVDEVSMVQGQLWMLNEELMCAFF
jgi:hypothetical protein